MEEEQACRRALQKREVPNYFDSEWGKSFLLSLRAGPDMDALTKNLAVETRKGEGEGNNHSLPSTPAETPISAGNGMFLQVSHGQFLHFAILSVTSGCLTDVYNISLMHHGKKLTSKTCVV